MKKDKTRGIGYSLKYLSLELIVLLSGSFLYWWSVRCGINLTYDSTAYISQAGRNIPLVPSPEHPWPPLYSFVLYILHNRVGLSYKMIQFVFMVTNFLLLSVIGQRTLPNPMIRLVWLAASFLGVSFLMIHVFLWSEPLFLVLLLPMIILFDRYLRKRKINRVVWLIVFSNLLCLERNAGIFFMAGLVVSLASLLKGRKRIIIPVIFLVTGSISFIAWNLWLPGLSAGMHLLKDHAFFHGIFFNLGAFLDTASAWFLPRQVNSIIRIIILISGCAVLVAERPFSGVYKDPESIIYILIIVYGAGISLLGKIDIYETERYLAVIYPLALLPVLKRLSSVTGRLKYKHRIFVAILMILWLSYTVARSVINAERWEKAGCSAITLKQP